MAGEDLTDIGPSVVMDEGTPQPSDVDFNFDNTAISDKTMSEAEDDGDGSGPYLEDKEDLVDDGSSEDEPAEDGPPKVQKAEWSEDMVQTPEMAQLGICVNNAAKVIVCLACSAVIKPSEFSRHLARTHPPISSTASFFEQLVDAYDLHEDPHSSRPGSIITAIYGLDLVPGYLTCDSCGYACKTPKRMQIHLGKSQGCEEFSPRLVQTFQPTARRMYFGVELHPVVEELGDPLDPFPYITKVYAPPSFADVPITSPESACDANHFLTIEPWLTLIEGKTGREINELVRERDPDLRKEVRLCVERYALTATEALNEAGHEAGVTIGDYVG